MYVCTYVMYVPYDHIADNSNTLIAILQYWWLRLTASPAFSATPAGFDVRPLPLNNRLGSRADDHDVTEPLHRVRLRPRHRRTYVCVCVPRQRNSDYFCAVDQQQHLAGTLTVTFLRACTCAARTTWATSRRLEKFRNARFALRCTKRRRPNARPQSCRAATVSVKRTPSNCCGKATPPW